ncbi:SLC39A12 [Symbiodinium necroappetens]|uniref:SLC39A12 protein n=1 Tax=Symbiodinium necroappetens TaxID=1628268 RepID=A0A812KU23_9DINO|nr:SLC39A12 [Symbiodinium necroappetens]
MRHFTVLAVVGLGLLAQCHAHTHDDGTTHSHDGDSHDDHDDHSDAVAGAEFGGIGEAMGASLVTMLPTLLGIFVLMGACIKRAETFKEVFEVPVKSFASGVVLGTSSFILLPEALHYLAVGVTEKEATTMWGIAVISGWLFGAVIDHITSLAFPPKVEENHVSPVKEVEMTAASEEDDKAAKRNRLSIAGPILLGDGLHNVTDGFMLGLAFRTCDRSVAWGLVVPLILHELPQEIADFIVLVTEAKFHWVVAVILNVLSGATALVGALVGFGVDMSSATKGWFMAAGGGTFLYIAITELGPAVAHIHEHGSASTKRISPIESIKRLVPFIIGVAIMTWVYQGHEHATCSANGQLDEHGHSH